jgi:assimilatory nitrate reductase catalytic subunit
LLGAGEAVILEAIQSGCVTATDIGAHLMAGTNCGSCVPELKELLAQQVVKKIA